MDDEELLSQQRAYYQARAATYDEWWQRRGPYDRGPAQAREWDRQIRHVERAVVAFGIGGNVLELAGARGGGPNGSPATPGG